MSRKPTRGTKRGGARASEPAGGGLEAALAALRGHEFDRASRLLSAVVAAPDAEYDALCRAAQLFHDQLNDADNARRAWSRAVALEGARPQARIGLMELDLQHGRLDAAVAAAEEILAADPSRAGAWRVLAEAAPKSVTDDQLGALADLCARGEGSPFEQRMRAAAAGQILHARGDYDAAFERFGQANALEPITFDPTPLRRNLQSLREHYPAIAAARGERGGLSTRRNGFIIGMLRSGSTLLEQVALAHPRIDSCGEADFIQRGVRSAASFVGARQPLNSYADLLAGIADAERQRLASAYQRASTPFRTKKDAVAMVNKCLYNWEHVGFVLSLLPRAPIIHAYRHPLDAAFSCWRQNFFSGDFHRGFESLAEFYLLYDAYMELWEQAHPGLITHIRHESFVENFATAAPAYIDALGVKWRPECAEPHRAASAVRTASVAQVRSPVSAAGFGAWRRYERHLGPLIEAFGGMAAVEALDEKWRARSAV